MIDDEYLYERNFFVLFEDALNLLSDSEYAIEKEDYYGMQRFARSSIVNSTILLECSANCCLDALKLSNSFKNDLDKLPSLSKFEFYLTSKFRNKNFDRGCNEIQNVAELKTLRDIIVHPKVQKAKWERIDENRRQADFGTTNKLKLPRTFEDLEYHDAIICLRVLCSFLDHFFRVLCQFDHEYTNRILISSSEFKENSNTSYGSPGHWAPFQEKWSLRLEFVGIKCTNVKTI